MIRAFLIIAVGFIAAAVGVMLLTHDQEIIYDTWAAVGIGLVVIAAVLSIGRKKK